MATHTSVLAWRIPGTAEPGGLPSMGLHRVRHDWSDLAAAAAMDTQKWNLRDNTTVHEKMLNITSLREMQLKPQWEIFAARWQSRKTLNSPPPMRACKQLHWRRNWPPTTVFLPRESHRQRSLEGCSPQGHKRVRHDWSDLVQHIYWWIDPVASIL